jgi:glycerol uptake facilitator-like aquaporin
MEIAGPARMRPTAADVRAAAVEFGLTTTFMATVFSLVHWGIGTAPPNVSAAELRLRVAVVSILVGLIIVGFATSPPGRFSGAHMNPAITLGMYAAGRLPARRVLPYVTAQAAGSIAAAAVLRLVWGPAVAEGPARWAVVQPGPGWTGVSVAAAETATLLAIVGVMCWMAVCRPRWRAAWVVGGLFGLQGAVLGTTTGGSANPARQWGPAVFSGETRLLAVYLIAPVAGAVLAGWAARRLQHDRRRTTPGATERCDRHRTPARRIRTSGRTESRPERDHGLAAVARTAAARRRQRLVRRSIWSG